MKLVLCGIMFKPRSIKNLSSFFLLYLTVFFYLCPANASEKRPIIGLALSGGGVKGFAHIGALKVIEKAGIHVDMVSGSSMGAVIGALYAAGYSPEQIEKMVSGEDWEKIMHDKVSHRKLDHFEKESDGQYSLRFQGGTSNRGLIKGQSVIEVLCRWFSPIHDQNDFSKFPRSFACLATDLETGKPIRLTKGFLPMALRASISYPFAFTPVELDGYLLADGGIARNLPVSDLKELGADIVIAVNVGSSLYTKEQINSIPQILEQCVSFFGEQDIKTQKKLCAILIEPDVKGYSTFAFGNVPQIIQKGEKSTQKYLDRLKKLALKAGCNVRASKIRLPDLDRKAKMNFASITIEGVGEKKQKYLFDRIGGSKDRKLSLNDIQHFAQKMMGTGLAQSVSSKISTNTNKTKTLTYIIEEAHGHEKDFGLRYDIDRGMALKANITSRNRIFVGDRLSVSSVIAERPRFTIKEYVHEFPKLGFGYEFELQFSKNKVSSKFNYSDHLKYNSANFTGKLSLNKKLANSSMIGFGIQKIFSFVDYDLTPKLVHNKDYEYASVFGFFKLDSLDDPFYPRSGNKINFEVKRAMNPFRFGSDRKIEEGNKISADLASYISFSDETTLGLSSSWGSLSEANVPGDELFHLGGKRIVNGSSTDFAGLKYQSISGSNMFITGAELRYKLKSDHYLFGRWNSGKIAGSQKDLFSSEKYITGGEVAYSLGTPVGVCEISVGTNDFDHNLRLQTTLGNSF